MKHIILSFTCLLLALANSVPAAAFENNTGSLNNLVVFVRFADEGATDVFTKDISVYEHLFNGSDESDNSVYNYFRQASYGQLSWTSQFFPAANGTAITSYRTNFERGYYQEKTSLNPSGYDPDNSLEAPARMQALIKEIAQYLSGNLTSDINVDVNGDGIVDNLTIIFSGGSDIGNKHLLWPKRTDLALPDEKAIYIKGVKLTGYLMVFDEANGYDNQFTGIALNTGVLCHEMSHSLGTYDLYHANDNLSPVGVWDLMSDNQVSAQGMTAYTKQKYCKWITIPTISAAGTYTLNPVGGSTSENIAYKIQPNGSDEYFIVEYRRKSGFDANLPASGLLVYRINPNFTGGNVNYNGSTRLDEQYIFRPGGTIKSDGDITAAAFSSESGRTAFGGTADFKPFYSDGSEAHFAITDIGSAGATISFALQPMQDMILLKDSLLRLKGAASSSATTTVSADVAWTLDAVPSWLTVSPTSGEAGKTVVTITAAADNAELASRSAALVFKNADGSISAQLNVVQASNIVEAPQGLKATVSDNAVNLSWEAVMNGTPILSDNFENAVNPNGWLIENSDSRGWTFKTGAIDKGFYRPHAGTCAMTMIEAWDEQPETQILTSPVFDNGKTLVFYSRMNGVRSTPKIMPVYNVEVSRDNGATWDSVYSAINDADLSHTSGKYNKIVVDLTPYQSSQMKVRFRASTTSPLGLSYYWQIDDLDIYPAESAVSITGYNIYRNGTLIGNTAQTSFTDTKPSAGDNVYTVTAVGNFGESSVSDAATANVATAISKVVNASARQQIYTIGGIRVNSMTQPGIYIVNQSGTVRKVVVGK